MSRRLGKLPVHLGASQQIVAEEDTQGASHFEVLVPCENPVKLLGYILQDVILILNKNRMATQATRTRTLQEQQQGIRPPGK